MVQGAKGAARTTDDRVCRWSSIAIRGGSLASVCDAFMTICRVVISLVLDLALIVSRPCPLVKPAVTISPCGARSPLAPAPPGQVVW